MKILIFILATIATSSSLLAIDECPVKFGDENYSAKVSTLALEAHTCHEASEIVSACSLGSSIDIFLVGSAIERCERDMTTISKTDKTSYDYLNQRCDDKYASMEGSMYRSANAFCRLAATRFFHNLLIVE